MLDYLLSTIFLCSLCPRVSCIYTLVLSTVVLYTIRFPMLECVDVDALSKSVQHQPAS